MLENIRLARSRSISRSVSIFTAAAALLTAIGSAEAATYQIIHQFDAASSPPNGGLLVGPDGALYGTTLEGGANGGGSVFKLAPPAPGQSNWVYSDLYDFPSYSSNGPILPNGGLVMDASGALYGTSAGGVFKLTPPTPPNAAWTLSTVYNPGLPMQAGLVIDQNGTLYGTTVYCWTCVGGALPTAFKIVPPGPQGSAASVSVFTFNVPRWTSPQGRLLLDATGALVGTLTDPPGTKYFGNPGPGYDINVGFRLVPPPAGSNDWTAGYVYFPGGSLGVGLNGSIIEDANGAFYGTTVSGGDTVDGAATGSPCRLRYDLSGDGGARAGQLGRTGAELQLLGRTVPARRIGDERERL
ncbi:MAG: hypothetical protein JO255_09650, partial [Alphaproteobacteria bacterium]|nr:hypothetical protein [Alphaproteobacteria bacterium]